MKNSLFKLTPVTIAVSTVLYGQAALAQEEAANAAADIKGLEEVVVYARKMDETEQTVPISMVTQTADQLKNSQVVNFNDFADLTPGLEITSDDPTSTSIKMRGVGLDFFGLAADPGVVILVDEFPQSRIGSVFGAFMDVQQVEVLKGPQGTLYGRNAPNGAINIWSKKPDHNGLHGYVELDLSENNTYQAETAVNVPIIEDKLAIRFARLQTESDGYADLAVYETDTSDPNQTVYRWNGATKDADTRNGENNRLTILFEPSDSLSMLGKINHTDFKQGGVSAIFDGPVVFDPLTDPITGLPQTILPSIVVDGNGNQVIADRSDRLMFQESPDRYKYNLKEGGLRTQWDNEYGRLISLSFYQEFETQLNETAEDLVAPKEYILPRQLTSFDRLVSQELRWQADLNDNITYLTGVYYSNQTLYLTYQQYILGTPLTVEGDQTTEVYGYFTSWDFQLDPQWSISVGARYSEERERIDAFIDLSAVPGIPPALTIGDIEDQQYYYNTSYSFKTRYEFNDNIMAYLAVDTAYKSGGYNPPVAGMSTLSLLGPEYANFTLMEQELLLYPPEESTAIEIGVKTSLMDNRMRLNVALFDQNFTDFQNFQAADPSRLNNFDLGSAFINAVDKVNTHGVEMDLNYLISENWFARFGASYYYATAQEFDTNFCAKGEGVLPTMGPPATAGQLFCPISDDSRLNDDPLWNTNLQVQYTRFLSWKDAELVTNFTLITNGEKTSDNGIGNEIEHGATSTANLNVGLNFENWRFKLWVTNLFDKEFYDKRELRSPGSTASLGLAEMTTGELNKPRTFGFNVNYRFGGE